MTATVVPGAVLANAAELLARRVGLRLDPAIRARLARCVLDDAAAHQLDVSVYVDHLAAEPALMQSLLDRVTVQESSFFRDPNQFAALRESALPDLPGPVTVWSAGCANGQEPYSLAMTLADAGLREWRVIASDISTRAVERARRGHYSSREMRGITADQRARHFAPAGAGWQAVDALREPMKVLHHNLAADPPPFSEGECDIVFCRNVLIYFRQEDLVALLDRFARLLRPGAWLFLGYSESLWQVTDAFQLLRLGDAFAYRRRDGPGRDHVAATGQAPARTARAGQPRGGSSLLSHSAAPRDRWRINDAAASPARRSNSGTDARVGPAKAGPYRPRPSSPLGMVELAAAGEAALNADDYTAAIAAFRKCAYLEPDQPVAHFHLGLALEAAGDSSSARRAYGTARRTLRASGTAGVETALEGYHVAELARLLDAKLETPS